MSRVAIPLAGSQMALAVTTGAAVALTVPRGAQFALISVNGGPIRVRNDGTNPTTSVGRLVQPGTVLPVSSNLANFKMIAAVTAATVDIEYFDAVPFGPMQEQPSSVIGVADTLGASGTAAAPGAGSNFVSRAAPPAGVYRITGSFLITGAVETAALNVRVLANNASVMDLPSAQNIPMPFEVPRIALDGTNVVALRAVAAAAVSTVYSGWLQVTRLG